VKQRDVVCDLLHCVIGRVVLVEATLYDLEEGHNPNEENQDNFNA
jgi:hypothetical protein